MDNYTHKVNQILNCSTIKIVVQSKKYFEWRESLKAKLNCLKQWDLFLFHEGDY